MSSKIDNEKSLIERRYHAKVAIVEAIDEVAWKGRFFRHIQGKGITQTVNAYNAGEILIDDDCRTVFPTLKAGAVGLWYKTYLEKGPNALVDKWGRKSGTVFDRHPVVKSMVDEIVASEPNLSAAEVLKRVETQTNKRDLPSPSLRSLQHYLSSRRQEIQNEYQAE